MDREYWGDMEFRLEGELRSMLWKEVERAYAEVMSGDMKAEAFEDRIHWIFETHATLLGIAATSLADAANKDGGDD